MRLRRGVLEDDSGSRGRASRGLGGRRSPTNLTPPPQSLPQAKLARPWGLSHLAFRWKPPDTVCSLVPRWNRGDKPCTESVLIKEPLSLQPSLSNPATTRTPNCLSKRSINRMCVCAEFSRRPVHHHPQLHAGSAL